MTYQEIEQSSNQLAHALICHGIERCDRVAVYLPNLVGKGMPIIEFRSSLLKTTSGKIIKIGLN